MQRAPAGQPSPLVGYARDGYPIYGRRTRGGHKLRAPALDSCHGVKVKIQRNGRSFRTYH